MESINKRIALLINELGMNKNSFSKKIGLTSNTVLENIVGKRQSKPGFEVLNKIILSIENISTQWLMTGEGEMFITSDSKILPTKSNKDLEENFIELPYVSIAARATFSISCDILHDPTETYNTYRNSTFDYNNVMVLEVNGDSMEPTLVSSEKVLIREVVNTNWEYFTGLAAIAFKNMFVVKRITRNTGGILTLSSDNPLGGSFEVKMDDVRSIYKIEHSVYRPLK